MASAHFGPIRVYKRIGRLSAGTSSPAAHERLVAAYLSHPLLAEAFEATQAAEVVDPTASGPKCIDDYQTIYESATRLTDYLHYAGYNSAVVSVMADGSSIFPNPQLAFTPRYDSGRLVERLQGADGLELALRVFDRERLTLVPAIELAAPIPQLEEMRRKSDPRATGLELVGPDGRTWLETNGTRDGLAPYYNILEPHVQAVLVQVVQDLIARYGNHRSFGGLAVQLSGAGFSQLPSLEWGLDDATIDRFEHADWRPNRSGRSEPLRSSQKRAHRQICRRLAEVRARRKLRSFTPDSQASCAGASDRRLLLTTERLFDNSQVGDLMRPNLLAENRIAAALLDLGLDRQALATVPGLVYCPTFYVEPMSPLPDRAIDVELNSAFARQATDDRPRRRGRRALPSSA